MSFLPRRQAIDFASINYFVCSIVFSIKIIKNHDKISNMPKHLFCTSRKNVPCSPARQFFIIRYLQSRIILSASFWDRPYLSINFTAISWAAISISRYANIIPLISSLYPEFKNACTAWNVSWSSLLKYSLFWFTYFINASFWFLYFIMPIINCKSVTNAPVTFILAASTRLI